MEAGLIIFFIPEKAEGKPIGNVLTDVNVVKMKNKNLKGRLSA
jgi:hypothetical protein